MFRRTIASGFEIVCYTNCAKKSTKYTPVFVLATDTVSNEYKITPDYTKLKHFLPWEKQHSLLDNTTAVDAVDADAGAVKEEAVVVVRATDVDPKERKKRNQNEKKSRSIP